MSLAMPFIDNDLLWSSDHDGKMVDISSCLQDASTPVAQPTAGMGLGELSQSDLSSLVPPLPEANIADNEDIFKHLSDTTSIEIDTLLNEFNSTPYIKQEENNNIPNCPDEALGNSATHHKSAQVMLEMRSLKFTIAAANPILAEKLATPSEQNVQQNSNSNRPQLAPLTPKIEKGKAPGFYSNWGFCRANEKVNCLGNFVNRFPGQC
jgi:E74-like factor 1/2/4